MIADFASDSKFRRMAESLHEAALRSRFEELAVFDVCPHINAAEIVIGEQISLSYGMSLLSPAYFETPAMIRLRLDHAGSSSGRIEYGCGLLDHDGEFSTTRRSVVPCNDSEWAVFESFEFNTKILDEWRLRNSSAG